MIKTLKHLRFMLMLLLATLGMNVAFGAEIFSFTVTSSTTAVGTYDAVGGTARVATAFATGGSNEVTVGNQTFYKFNSSTNVVCTLSSGSFAVGDVITFTGVTADAKTSKGVKINNAISVLSNFSAKTATEFSYTVVKDDGVAGQNSFSIYRADSDIKFGSVRVESASPVTPVCPKNLTIASKDNKTAFEEGDKIELSSALEEGNGTITYQWYKDEVAISGATDKNYTVNACTVDDAGSYTCKATKTDCTDAVSEALVLTVKEDPWKCYSLKSAPTLPTGAVITRNGVAPTYDASNGVSLGANTDYLCFDFTEAEKYITGIKVTVKTGSKDASKGFAYGFGDGICAPSFTAADTKLNLATSFTEYEITSIPDETQVVAFRRVGTSTNINNICFSYADAPAVVKHHVTYAKGEATCDITMPTQADVKENGTFKVAEAVACDGLNFTIWSDGTNTYAPGATYTMGSADVVLTAKWKAAAQKFTVIYMDGETEISREDVEDGQKAANVPTPKKELNTFAGWEDAEHNPVNFATAIITGNLTVYAKWAPFGYASSVDLAAEAAGSKTAIATFLAAANIDSKIDASGAYDTNGLYTGFKMKKKGDYIIFKLESGKRVKITMGYVETGVTLTINDEAQIFETSKTEVSTFTYDATADVVVKMVNNSADKSTTTLKAIEISETPAVSDDATLSDLKVAGQTVAGFAADKLTYNVELPYGTTEVPAVTATKHDEKANDPVITPAASLPGATTVAVTAEDGTTTKTYEVNFTIAPKQGVTLIEAAITGATTATVTGAIGGTADVNITGSNYKMDKGKYVGVALANENEFEAGDIVVINVIDHQNATGFTLYTEKEGTNLVIDTRDGVVIENGKYYITLPAGFAGSNAIYAVRLDNSTTGNLNACVNDLKVMRYMAPGIQSYTIAGVEADVNPEDKIITAEVPFGTNIPEAIANATVEAFANGSAHVTKNATNVVVASDYAEDGVATYTLNITEAAHHLAKIGETYYDDLATFVAAVADIPTDGTETTITLLDDVELTSMLTTKLGQNIILDLNGHNITSSVTAIKNAGKLEVTGTGNITVTGTTKTAYGISNYGGTALVNRAYLTVGENVTITAPCSAVFTTYAYTTVKGTLANTYAETSSNMYSTLRQSNSSEVIVAATANVTGLINAIYGAQGTLEVYSTNVGKIFADGSATQGLKIKKTAAIESLDIYGHAEFSDVEDYYVAAKAISACNNGTVKLLCDINAAIALSADKAVTLDLNGHKVATETYPIKVDKGHLTIKGIGTIQSTGMGSTTAVQAAAYVTGGTLTIESGNFVAGFEGEEGNPAVYVTKTGTAEIKGGDFVGGPKFLLNILDKDRATAKIIVTGGTFHGFNPEDNTAEGEHTNFCAENYGAIDNGDNTYTVVRIYTFSRWNGTSATFTKDGEWTIYSVDGNGVPQNTTKFAADQQIENVKTNPAKATALVDRRFAVKFDKEVKSINFRAYAGNNNRTLLSVKESAQMPTAKASYTDVTAKYELINGTLATDRDYNYTINGHFEANKYYLIDVNNGSINFYDFFYTEAEVVSHVTIITEVKINGEALDATELAAFIANKGMTLPKTDAAFTVKVTDIVKDIYDDGFEKVLATNETDALAGEQGDNFVATFDINGVTYTVTAPKMADPVAKIGTAKFETLAEAVEAAQAGDEIVLVADIDLTATGLTIDKEVTLDLNGHNIKAGESITTNIYVTGKLTVEDNSADHNGKIYTEAAYSSANNMGVVRVDGGEFILNSGNIEAVLADAANNGQFGVVAANGAKITINGGQIKAGWYAISANGTDASTLTVVVNGGELISTADYAIYQPAKNMTTTITNGVVYGATGAIAANAGVVTVNGGTITSKGQGSTGTWGDGTGGLTNAAININAKYGNTTCAITGGKIIADGDAVTMNTGATYTATIAVSGGAFSSVVPAEYCAEGYEPVTTPNAEGLYEVEVQSNPLDVTESMTWDFTNKAAADADKSVATENKGKYVVLAATDIKPTFANALYMAANYNKYTAKAIQATGLKIHTTVPGLITVTFAQTGGNNVRELYINNKATGATPNGTTNMTYSQYVPAGDVVLTAWEASTSKWQMFNYATIKFQTLDYTRNVTAGNYGTICLPYAIKTIDGAEMYSIAGYTGNQQTPSSMVLEEVTENFVAGQPYIFKATASEIRVIYTGDEETTAGSHNGLVGTFERIEVAEGNYLISQNRVMMCGVNCFVGANRAYIDFTEMSEYQESQAAAGRIVIFPMNGTPGVATGLDAINAENQSVKIFRDGKILIIRGARTYDATGRLMK